MAVRAEPTVTVMCADCGGGFELSKRNALEHRRRGTQPRCRDCRCPGRYPTREAIETMKNWWLSRYSLAELQSWDPLP